MEQALGLGLCFGLCAMLESDLQRAVIMWAKTQLGKYPELLWLHHVPMGGKRDAREALSLQMQGVKAGILDLALDVARGGYHGLRIELKKPGGKCKTPSKEQLEYIDFLTQQGYATLVSNDFDEVKAFIINYMESSK